MGPYPEREPFDAVHINSVDRDVQGDYLILMKWFAQVVKVAGLSNVRKRVELRSIVANCSLA